MEKQKNPGQGRKEILADIEPYLLPHEIDNIETAYIFAKYGHRTQMRDGGTLRYFEHLKSVALIIIRELEIRDWETIVMALLHDISEDTYILSWERIALNFGKDVARGIKLLTKRDEESVENYIIRIEEYGKNNVLLVKLADRLHNLRTLSSCTTEKQSRKIKETESYYIPLALRFITTLPEKEKWRGEYLHRAITDLCSAHHEKC